MVNATKPQFDEVHVVLSAFVKQLQRWNRYGLESFTNDRFTNSILVSMGFTTKMEQIWLKEFYQ